MTSTAHVSFRDTAFWAYDVAGGVFLRFLIQAAIARQESLSEQWLDDAIEKWRVSAVITELSYYAEDTWSPLQVDTVIRLSREAIRAIRQHGHFAAEEIQSWPILDDQTIYARGHDPTPDRRLHQGIHWRRRMKSLLFVGSVLGTVAALLAACLVVVATLIWLIWQWEARPWVVWAAGLGMMGTAVAVIWRWWRLPIGRRFRFSMRGMLVGITLFALWFGLVGADVLRWVRMRTTLADLFRDGVTVEYYYVWGPRGPLRDLSLRIFGYDVREKVQSIEIRSDQGLAALLEHADDLPDLERVCFHAISSAGLARVGELNQIPRVRGCEIDRCAITDSGLGQLTDWRNLEEFRLDSCVKITDAGLAHLKKLPNLRIFTLAQHPNSRKMPVTDAGLVHVADLQQLQVLRITCIPVTDAGIAHLQFPEAEPAKKPGPSFLR